jgi:hypothetical protein
VLLCNSSDAAREATRHELANVKGTAGEDIVFEVGYVGTAQGAIDHRVTAEHVLLGSNQRPATNRVLGAKRRHAQLQEER